MPSRKPGGNEYSWDGKGDGFESDQDFFQKGSLLFQIKLSANYLSAYLLSAELSYLGIVFFLLRAFF